MVEPVPQSACVVPQVDCIVLATQDHPPLANEYSYTPQSLSMVIRESRSGKYSRARQQSGLDGCETGAIVPVQD